MKKELIGILGMREDSTDQEVIARVKEIDIELRGKMGYGSAPIVEKMIKDGILKKDDETKSYTATVSEDFLKSYLRNY